MVSAINPKQDFSQNKNSNNNKYLKQYYVYVTSSKKLETCPAFILHDPLSPLKTFSKYVYMFYPFFSL